MLVKCSSGVSAFAVGFLEIRSCGLKISELHLANKLEQRTKGIPSDTTDKWGDMSDSMKHPSEGLWSNNPLASFGTDIC